MTKHPWTWLALLLLAALAGCGGSQTAQSRVEPNPSAQETAGGEAEEPPSDARTEILRLEQQIQARVGAVPPSRQQGQGTQDAGVPGVARTPGTEPAAASCEMACQASGSICQAAARICSLADQMDDDWARGRCRQASHTCTDVRRRSTNACGAC